MRTAQTYVDLGLAEARAQWLSIEARTLVAGRRQAVFEPVETLLCLAASLVVDHRRYGGSSNHRAEEPVPTLARLFRRPNSSILAKMANLYGTRSNGGRGEIEAATILLSDSDRLANIYRIIFAAARETGISELRLPDFIDAEDEADGFTLLGQDELDQTVMENEISAATATADRFSLDSRLTERVLAAVMRVGQHRFAAAVLRNQGHRCAFCGLAVKSKETRARRMLIASHIKPWKDSAPGERLDVSNGLAACPTHDVGFDTGLLTVDLDLRIHVAPELRDFAKVDPATRAAFGSPPLFDRLQLSDNAARPGQTYLTWHHNYVYQADLDA
ncbi:HNH endonuclease [Dactylosporangium cerinum]|uniref:HNH endonuclease n=1 Tax=Dactylosporangium cerinum TaxID=1434730 RepID=A0ABV9VXJ6_9ACTN